MAEERNLAKAAVVKAYSELSASLVQTSLAINQFTTILAGTSDAQELKNLMADPPAVPYFHAPGEEGADKTKAKPEKKARKAKDPNAPKRPASAYLEYQNAVRNSFRDQDPEAPYTDVLRKISATWTAMSEADKKVFQDVTAAKAATYEIEKKAYDLAHPGEYIPEEAEPAAEGSEAPIKKRGRKSAVEKAKIVADNGGVEEATVAKAVAAVNGEDKKGKKEKKGKKADDIVVATTSAAPAAAGPASKIKTPKAPKVVKAPTPPAADSSAASDSDDSEVASGSDSSDDDSAPAPVVVATPITKKRKDEKDSATKGKKKTKTAA